MAKQKTWIYPIVSKTILWAVLLISCIVKAQETESRPKIMITDRPPGQDANSLPVHSLPALREEILNASPDDIFAVEMSLQSAVQIAAIRDAAQLLQIPRVLAFVEYKVSIGRQRSSTVVIRLGTLYEDLEDWQKEICRAQIFATNNGAEAFLKTPPEQWLLKKIHVHGTAYAIRKLQSGTLLPMAHLVSGSAQQKGSTKQLASYIEERRLEKIEVADNFSASPDCQLFVRPIEAGILTGNSTYSYPASVPASDVDVRKPVYEVLAEFSPDTPVTLSITFKAKANVEQLATLVEEYGIDGLLAELKPSDRGKRIIMQGELSIYGVSPLVQAKRIRCQMGVGATADATSEWTTRRARVSIPVNKSWDLLANHDLLEVQLISSFEPGKLRRLEVYYQQKKFTDIILVPASRNIPEKCEAFIKII